MLGFQSSAREPVPLLNGSSEYHISTWPVDSIAAWMATTSVLSGEVHDPVPCSVWSPFRVDMGAVALLPHLDLSPTRSTANVIPAASDKSRHVTLRDGRVVAVSLASITPLKANRPSIFC